VQQDHFAIVVREPLQDLGQPSLPLLPLEPRSDRRRRVGQDVPQALGRSGEGTVERDLAAEVAGLHPSEAAELMGEHPSEDLPEPGRQLAVGLPTELRPRPDRLQHRLLDDV